ncbi:MAG: hypothetical protein AAF564_05990 [Bacteroidota bacterium]
MIKFLLKLVGSCLVVTMFTGCGTSPKSVDEYTVFAGTWQSDPVRFVRGDIDETYSFELRTDDNVMQVIYASTGSEADKRTITQTLTVSINDESGKLVLAGASPELISGPAFVGRYGADVLYCDLPQGTAETLECLWGSDAHGESPVVMLRPVGQP